MLIPSLPPLACSTLYASALQAEHCSALQLACCHVMQRMPWSDGSEDSKCSSPDLCMRRCDQLICSRFRMMHEGQGLGPNHEAHHACPT